MNAEIEAAVAELVQRHGFEAVNDEIFALLGRFDWETVQRVSNLARRVASRKVQFAKLRNFRKQAISGPKSKKRRSKMTAIE